MGNTRASESGTSNGTALTLSFYNLTANEERPEAPDISAMQSSCKLTALRVILATLFLTCLNSHATTMREKTFVGQEILSNWNVFDNSGEKPLTWEGISDNDPYITFQGDIILKSVHEYYNVRSVTIEYRGDSNPVSPYPPTVGDTTFESSQDEEKAGSPMVSAAPAYATPMGHIEIMIQSSRRQQVAIPSITIVYDAGGASRNLKWTATSVTARLGETFEAPTLTGSYLLGISYSSSDQNVAYIDASGKVSILGVGTSTITASAPSEGVWNASSASYLLTVTSSMTAGTINIATPGTLREKLVDLDSRPQHLIVTGTLNSADLSYIAQAQGKIGSVQVLDISGITLDYDNGLYNSITGSDGTGIGLGTLTRKFYLSKTCHNDTTSTSNGLGGGNMTISHYSNNLSGLFINNKALLSVKLPKSLSGIGSFLFLNSAISDVTLPNNITEISEYAFSGTTNLTVFNSPVSITKVGECAFNNSSIRDFKSSSILAVGDNAFSGSQIEHFDFSALQEIGNSAFESTKGFSGEVNLLSATSLGEKCFSNTGFTSVFVGENIESIPAGAFSSSSISTVHLPINLRYIGEGAFSNCNNLDINIPDGVEFIGNYAFPYEWLYNRPTENGVWYIAKVAYRYDNRLAGTETLSLRSGIKSISPGFVTDALRSTLKTLILPDGLEAIGECNDQEKIIAEWRRSCFYNCEKLESVTLPEGLITIGDGAFFGCKKLQIEDWPKSLRDIGQTAFLGCEALYNLTLGENLKFLGSQAFQDCPNISNVKLYSTNLLTSGSPFWGGSIEKVTIGPNVTKVPYRMFDGCTALIKVVFEDNDAMLPSLSIGESAFNGCVNLKIESLPLRTKYVGKSAFLGTSFGENFSTNNITEIGESAFSNCKGFVSLTLTSNLESCGPRAFSDIDSLRVIYYNAPNLYIPSDSDHTSPFSRGSNFKATGISSVTIGPNVNIIPRYLFNYQPGLTSLKFEERDSSSRSNNSLQIEERAFHSCQLESLELPDVRTAIGQLAFAYNIPLNNLRIGNGTENIDKQAFYQCHSLASVDIPSSVVSIGEEAFYQFLNQSYPYSPQMATAYLHFKENPEIGYHAFRKDVRVYVQPDMLTEYQASGAGWNTLIPYAIEYVSLAQTTATLEAGSELLLTAAICPSEYSDMDIEWSSSDPGVASVNNTGTVTGINDGKAIITASIAYTPGFSASCLVSVGDNSSVEGTNDDENDAVVGIFDLNGNYVGKSTECLLEGVYILKRTNSTLKILVR